MRCPIYALLVLCSLALVGCGFLDEDIHRTDAELAMGVGGIGIGGSGVGYGRSGGCGCGLYARRHARALHLRGYPGLMSELYLDDTYIYGRSMAGSEASIEVGTRQEEAVLPATPVESVAEHAENSRREALEEFAR